MTAQEAIELLAQATQPQMTGQINRQGYVRIEEALGVLAEVVRSIPTPDAKAGQNASEGPERPA